MTRNGSHYSSWDHCRIFETRKCAVRKKGIKRSKRLDIRIHVDSASIMENFQPCPVTYESPLTEAISLGCKSIHTGVKIRLVPFHYLIVRHYLFPCLDISLHVRRFRRAAVPNVMNDLWNHSNLHTQLGATYSSAFRGLIVKDTSPQFVNHRT